MKRVADLIPQIADWNNLTLAFWKAAKGRRNAVAVRRFQKDFLRECGRLSREIRDGTVGTGRFESFVIHDPKRRVIHAAPFRERVLHHAIMNVCGPYFERGAIDSSYACRIGKGNHAALARARRFAGSSAFFLKMDVRRYFDSVDHEILKARIRTLFTLKPAVGWPKKSKRPEKRGPSESNAIHPLGELRSFRKAFTLFDFFRFFRLNRRI